MIDLGRPERRREMRVPVRGVAVFYAEDGAVHGRIENLSQGGALVTIADQPTLDPESVEVELKLGVDTGWVTARAVRVERDANGRERRVAVAFDRLDDSMRVAIESAIACALRAAQRRPILVIDQPGSRRRDLVERLSARGMTPLTPATPLEAIDLLARSQLHVGVCLLAPSYGHSTAELRMLVADVFPWVSTADIGDDVDATVNRAVAAWANTEVAQFAVAQA
jgi:hypothetical protein